MWFAKKRVYMDYAGATPPLPEAVLVFRDAAEIYGNPGAIHAEGVVARTVLDASRASLARELGVKAREIVFTSGATEANNLAILGRFKRVVLSGRKPQETHWVVSAIEHPSVLECFRHIAAMGGNVTEVNPDGRGMVSAETVARALKPETVFVSVGWANHEIGVVQPLSKIARAIREHEDHVNQNSTSQTSVRKSDLWNTRKYGVIFHSDAGQAPLYISPQVHTLGVDLMTFDAGKLYAPRGTGLLVGKRHRGKEGALLAPTILGSGQEFGVRAGTENVALVAAFSEAFAIISKEREQESRRVQKLRDELARKLIARIPGLVINGDSRQGEALPHVLNVSIPNIQSEYLALQLDQASIAVSTKSACKNVEQFSHVVRALGGEAWRAESTIRISLGRDITARDIQKTIDVLVALITPIPNQRNN